MWYQELVILDAGQVLSLGAGALVLTCVSFMAGMNGIVARGMRFIACGVIGLVVLAA